jgi:hypothetical protein
MGLFDSIKYHLSPSLPRECKLEMETILDSNGAISVFSSSQATHVIAESTRFEGWQEVESEKVAIVTVSITLIIAYTQALYEPIL